MVCIRVAHTAECWCVLADGAPCATLSNEDEAVGHARRIAAATLRAGSAVLLQLDDERAA